MLKVQCPCFVNGTAEERCRFTTLELVSIKDTGTVQWKARSAAQFVLFSTNSSGNKNFSKHNRGIKQVILGFKNVQKAVPGVGI